MPAEGVANVTVRESSFLFFCRGVPRISEIVASNEDYTLKRVSGPISGK